MRRIDKDDILVILLVIVLSIFLYLWLMLGQGPMETEYLIAEMGTETYEDIKEILTLQGVKPTDAKIANYYVEYYK